MGMTADPAPCNALAKIEDSDVRRQRTQHRAESHHRESNQKHLLLAEHVGESTEDGSDDSADQQRDGHQPGHGRASSAGEVRQLRQQWNDDRLQNSLEHCGGDNDGEQEA